MTKRPWKLKKSWNYFLHKLRANYIVQICCITTPRVFAVRDRVRDRVRDQQRHFMVYFLVYLIYLTYPYIICNVYNVQFISNVLHQVPMYVYWMIYLLYLFYLMIYVMNCIEWLQYCSYFTEWLNDLVDLSNSIEFVLPCNSFTLCLLWFRMLEQYLAYCVG